MGRSCGFIHPCIHLFIQYRVYIDCLLYASKKVPHEPFVPLKNRWSASTQIDLQYFQCWCMSWRKAKQGAGWRMERGTVAVGHGKPHVTFEWSCEEEGKWCVHLRKSILLRENQRPETIDICKEKCTGWRERVKGGWEEMKTQCS